MPPRLLALVKPRLERYSNKLKAHQLSENLDFSSFFRHAFPMSANLTYQQLEAYISEQMRMSHVYQPVMLRVLLENGGRASTEDVAKALLSYDRSQVEYYENRAVVCAASFLTSRNIEMDSNQFSPRFPLRPCSLLPSPTTPRPYALSCWRWQRWRAVHTTRTMRANLSFGLNPKPSLQASDATRRGQRSGSA